MSSILRMTPPGTLTGPDAAGVYRNPYNHNAVYPPLAPLDPRTDVSPRVNFQDSTDGAVVFYNETPPQEKVNNVAVQTFLQPPLFPSSAPPGPVTMDDGTTLPPPREHEMGFDRDAHPKKIVIDGEEVFYYEYPEGVNGHSCHIQIVKGPAWIQGKKSLVHSGSSSEHARNDCLKELNDAFAERYRRQVKALVREMGKAAGAYYDRKAQEKAETKALAAKKGEILGLLPDEAAETDTPQEPIPDPVTEQNIPNLENPKEPEIKPAPLDPRTDTSPRVQFQDSMDEKNVPNLENPKEPALKPNPKKDDDFKEPPSTDEELKKEAEEVLPEALEAAIEKLRAQKEKEQGEHASTEKEEGKRASTEKGKPGKTPPAASQKKPNSLHVAAAIVKDAALEKIDSVRQVGVDIKTLGANDVKSSMQDLKDISAIEKYFKDTPRNPDGSLSINFKDTKITLPKADADKVTPEAVRKWANTETAKKTAKVFDGVLGKAAGQGIVSAADQAKREISNFKTAVGDGVGFAMADVVADAIAHPESFSAGDAALQVGKASVVSTVTNGAQRVALEGVKGVVESVAPKIAEKIPGVGVLKTVYTFGKVIATAKNAEQMVTNTVRAGVDLGINSVCIAGAQALIPIPVVGSFIGGLAGHGATALTHAVLDPLFSNDPPNLSAAEMQQIARNLCDQVAANPARVDPPATRAPPSEEVLQMARSICDRVASR